MIRTFSLGTEGQARGMEHGQNIKAGMCVWVGAREDRVQQLD